MMNSKLLLRFVLAIILLLVAIYGEADAKAKETTAKSTRSTKSTPPPKYENYTIEKVADGDTISVKSKNGSIDRVRFMCIDAPEKSQDPWGKKALEELNKLLPKNSMVVLKITQRDMYNRLIAEITNAKGQQVNKKLVEMGLCVHYPFQKGCDDYKKIEEEAKKAKRGVWSDKNFKMPWDYRKENGIGFRGQAAAHSTTTTTSTTSTSTSTTTTKKNKGKKEY